MTIKITMTRDAEPDPKNEVVTGHIIQISAVEHSNTEQVWTSLTILTS
jgi:hypothetical protein